MSLFSPQNMTSATTPSPFVVSASSFHVALPAYLAFDGALHSSHYWVTNGTSTGYLALDIGSGNSEILYRYTVLVNTIPEPNRAPKDWTVEGSNTGAWAGEEDTLDTVTGETSWGSGEGRTFICDTATTAYRYFRINVSANNGDTYLQTAELLFYTEDTYNIFSPQNMTGASTPSPFVASASSNSANLYPYLAFNALLGVINYWASSSSSTGWLKLDIGLGISKILHSYDLIMNTIPEPNRAPKDWTVEGSNTGAWAGEEDTLDTVTGETSWGSGEGRTFICDTATTAYRYFRINITLNNGDSLVQIAEFIFYELSKVETPIITPTSGAYPTSQLISMSCATGGAIIYYTTDGSTPDSGDNLYSTPFALTSAKTIKAIGIKAGLTDSDIVSEIYTISAIAIQPIINILT